MSTVAKRVAKGAALLERKHGADWRSKIDPESLDMADSCKCILGQLYDGTYEDMDGFDGGRKKLRIRFAERYGFDTEGWYSNSAVSWKELEDAWKKELAKEVTA